MKEVHRPRRNAHRECLILPHRRLAGRGHYEFSAVRQGQMDNLRVPERFDQRPRKIRRFRPLRQLHVFGACSEYHSGFRNRCHRAVQGDGEALTREYRTPGDLLHPAVNAATSRTSSAPSAPTVLPERVSCTPLGGRPPAPAAANAPPRQPCTRGRSRTPEPGVDEMICELPHRSDTTCAGTRGSQVGGPATVRGVPTWWTSPAA